jgi:hypothetical protein
MQNSSAFQFLALNTIHESATNPRRTFEESKLNELADFVPLTVLCLSTRKGAYQKLIGPSRAHDEETGRNPTLNSAGGQSTRCSVFSVGPAYGRIRES